MIPFPLTSNGVFVFHHNLTPDLISLYRNLGMCFVQNEKKLDNIICYWSYQNEILLRLTGNLDSSLE